VKILLSLLFVLGFIACFAFFLFSFVRLIDNWGYYIEDKLKKRYPLMNHYYPKFDRENVMIVLEFIVSLLGMLVFLYFIL